MIEIYLDMAAGGQRTTRDMLADTGGGSDQARFELVLDESDCLSFGGRRLRPVRLGGAYSGSFAIYVIRVRIPQLSFDQRVRVVGVPAVTAGFDGIACFRFLNCFTYGSLPFGADRVIIALTSVWPNV